MGIWYQDFYLLTEHGEKLMRDALSDPEHGEENRTDIQKRLEEMKQVPEERCHITRDQRASLERILNAK